MTDDTARDAAWDEYTEQNAPLGMKFAFDAGWNAALRWRMREDELDAPIGRFIRATDTARNSLIKEICALRKGKEK